MYRQLEKIPYEEAWNKVIASTKAPRQKEKALPVSKAVWHVSTEDIKATRDLPEVSFPFYDGYALRSSDVGDAHPGHPVLLPIVSGFGASGKLAVKVFTRESLPPSFDAVVRLEKADVKDGKLILGGPVRSGENVVKAGADVAAGSCVVREGEIITPFHLPLLKELGVDKMKVRPRCKVAFIPFVDNVSGRGRTVSYAQSFAAMLDACLVESVTGRPVSGASSIKRALARFSKESDAIVIIGGASVSSEDIVPQVLEETGEVLFHGIRMNPGKVCGAGIYRERPVFLAPGLFGSSCISFLLFIARYALYRQFGMEWPYVKARAVLSKDIEIKKGYDNIKFFRTEVKDGELWASPVEKPGAWSAAYTLLSESNSFSIFKEGEVPSRGDTFELSYFSPLQAVSCKSCI